MFRIFELHSNDKVQRGLKNGKVVLFKDSSWGDRKVVLTSRLSTCTMPSFFVRSWSSYSRCARGVTTCATSLYGSRTFLSVATPSVGSSPKPSSLRSSPSASLSLLALASADSVTPTAFCSHARGTTSANFSRLFCTDNPSNICRLTNCKT